MIEPEAQAIYIARQPILDLKENVVAWELLFRNSTSPRAVIDDEIYATSRVLVNVLNNLGTRALLGDRPGYVNFNSSMLLQGGWEALDPSNMIIELLESIVFDPSIIKVLETLREQGFRIALDDVLCDNKNWNRIEPILNMVDIVKVDVLDSDPKQVASFCNRLRNRAGNDLVLLAEKVESRKDVDFCRSCGFTLFQGFYYAKPELISAKRSDPSLPGLLRLMQLLHGDAGIAELEAEFKRLPELTFGLLRYLNSASVAANTRITSIRHALTMVGRRRLQQWLSLVIYARPGENPGDSALFASACQRARLMEMLAPHFTSNGRAFTGVAFLAGLLSRMDVITGRPVLELLEQFPADPLLKEAFSIQQGPVAKLLRLADAVEQDNVLQIRELVLEMGISEQNLKDAVLESVRWFSYFPPA